jgi:hypothetical protein
MASKNKLAWGILSDDEKGALVLSIQHGKSTWQAGEIMNKAHYKYLEIQARANHFFKMFTLYFESTGNIKIPMDIALNRDFREFILLTVFERRTLKEAIKTLGIKSAFIVPQARTRIIGESLKQLCEDDNPIAQSLYDLIMDFDRWNNSRILPIDYQEPSAFKRRNKTRLLKHLKNLSELDPYHIKRFTDRFRAKNTDRKPYYIALLSSSFEGGYEVLPVKRKTDIIEYTSKKLRLYLFKEKVDADEFGFLVSRYLRDGNKDCKSGQRFWPLYRKSINCAVNYLEVNNIITRRKHLEKAFRDTDHLVIRKLSKKANDVSDAQVRVNPDKFWDI